MLVAQAVSSSVSPETLASVTWPQEQDEKKSTQPSGLNSSMSHLVDVDFTEDAEERRLAYLGMEWFPPPVTAPPGGGAPALFAGCNYTRWRLLQDAPVSPGGRLVKLKPTMNPAAALSGHCMEPQFGYIDVLPPLDGSQDFDGVTTGGGLTGRAEWNSPPNEPIIFAQGGEFKLCWSPSGNFGIADGFIVPFETQTWRVYGATDTCNMGPGCSMTRRFFCWLPHKAYTHYLPTGTQCYIFVQASTSPLLYSRLTWGSGNRCGSNPGQGMLRWQTAWDRIVDPLSLIYLDHTRRDLEEGFYYRLCFCPAFDSSVDGVCGEPPDFVQQVGNLAGIMASYRDVSQAVRAQVMPMTRFEIRVDCGLQPDSVLNGSGAAGCDTEDTARVKLIERSWDPFTDTSEDLPFWNTSQTCPQQVEVNAWFSPPNCINTSSGYRLANGCQMPGGTNTSEKIFGRDTLRILPKMEGGINVAQIFQVCFSHRPLDIDNIAESSFNPMSDVAIRNNTRLYWKIGEMVVEPMRLLNARNGQDYCVEKDIKIRLSAPDLVRTNTLHGPGHQTQGPIIKVVEEDRARPVPIPVDNLRCGSMLTREADMQGIVCANRSYCVPRAQKIGNELVLTGGDPNHTVKFKKAGIFAVCYCEAWHSEVGACEDQNHWVLVGKAEVQGPSGSEDWVLDTGIIQSIDLSGFGFTDSAVIRILEERASCDTQLTHVEPTLCLFRRGVCKYQHPTISNATHVSDIPGSVRRHNSTNPIAYITSITASGDGQTALVRFAQVPVLDIGDILHFEDNIFPTAIHWARQRDLTEIIGGSNEGFQILEMLDVGLTARIALPLDPLPPIWITPPGQGRWWRTTKLRILQLRAWAPRSQLTVCWGVTAGDYLAFAGYINVINPYYMDRTMMGLTSTAAGSIAPVMISFWTSNNPFFREPRNPTQLRITYTNSSILAPAEAGAIPQPLGPMLEADQLHEASQAVCGQLIVELSSDHHFGFPVPQGCYFDFDRYDSFTRLRAIYILFEAKNGLKAMTRYTITLNMHLVEPISDFSVLDEPLIEIACLDDIVVKPEGIIEIGWVNPDKPIVEAAGPDDPKFHNVSGGPTMISQLDSTGTPVTYPEPPLLSFDDDQVGFSFLLRGDDTGRITTRSIIRLYMWPLTAWSFQRDKGCIAWCLAQQDHECGPWMQCSYEAAMSECRDVKRANGKPWTDSRQRKCEWYAGDRRCELDGMSYPPESGVNAVDACCVCGGGVRMNNNIVKLTLPQRLDPAFGQQVIHTVKVWNVRPVTHMGFFATRIGAQITNRLDEKPYYASTTGAYFSKAPHEDSFSTEATLIGLPDWGNSRPFKQEEMLNDFYMKMIVPITLVGTSGYGSPLSGTQLSITLPEGYECQVVLPVTPVGTGDDKLRLPVLPEDPPDGNGRLPDSTTGAGNAAGGPNITIIGIPSGQWMFNGPVCTFEFAPYLTLYQGQSVYLYVFAKNPDFPMPYTDPRNFWTVNFTSRGAAVAPENHSTASIPCGFNPPACNETGEDFYVNPIGFPNTSRDFNFLYPNASDLSLTYGPFVVLDEDGEEKNVTYTERFTVLGRLERIVGQPTHFDLGATSQLYLWFVPDLGSHRGGLLSITCPQGFEFPDPCNAEDLPQWYYSLYSPPYKSGSPRIWPLDGIGICFRQFGPNDAAVSVDGALVTRRHYGFQLGVRNPVSFITSSHTGEAWTFKLFIRDAYGRPRDGTYTTATYQPEQPLPWYLYYVRPEVPVGVFLDELRPSLWTLSPSNVEIVPIRFPMNVRGRLRVIAPDGYVWKFNPGGAASSFLVDGLSGQTAPMPGGVPPLPENLTNTLEWPDADLYLAEQVYGFKTSIEVPDIPPRASSNIFFFEWGFNESEVSDEPEPDRALFGRAAGATAAIPPVRTLRGFKIEKGSTLEGDKTRMWVWIETATHIAGNGSLEFMIPQHNLTFDGPFFPGEGGGYWCDVRTVQDFGSHALPSTFRCRRTRFPNALDNDLNIVLEERIELSAPGVGIPPGSYVIEFNVTNPAQANKNEREASSPCGRKWCFNMYSIVSSYEVLLTNGRWVSQESPFASIWQKQNDYWTSIPALRITTPMFVAEIVELDLDERLACKRNDRPGERSALVFAFMLDKYLGEDEDTIEIRAPIGFLFDSICGFHTDGDQVYPPAPGVPGRPAKYTLNGTNSTYDVEDWPSNATIVSCRGDGHLASIRLGGTGFQPRRLYMFRVELQRTPLLTPFINTWSLTYGGESSGRIPGYPVWTFPGSFLDPVSLSWTLKPDPLRTPVTLVYRPTNTLRAWKPRLLGGNVKLQPLLRIIMPPQWEVVVKGDNQMIQGGDCYAVIQQIGTCRLCDAPWQPHTLSCRREWNRQNVALVRLLGNATMEAMTFYSVAITIFNPHTANSFEVDARHWVLESFLGDPWPVWQPYGYEIDAMNVTGYKISELAKIFVEEPQDRNGSAYNSRMLFSMKFSENMPPVGPGDDIVLRAPKGYEVSILILGLINRVLCLGFQYLPATYRKVNKTEDPFLPQEPPIRDPVPSKLPLWASNGARLASAESANLSDTNGTIFDDYNFTVRRQHCFVDTYDDNTSTIRNLTGGLEWSELPYGTKFNVSVIRLNETEFPGIVLLCIQATWVDGAMDPENATEDECCAPCNAYTHDLCDTPCNATDALFLNGTACNMTQSRTADYCMETVDKEVPPGAQPLRVRFVSQSAETMNDDLRAILREQTRTTTTSTTTAISYIPVEDEDDRANNDTNDTNVSVTDDVGDVEDVEEKPAPCVGLAMEVLWGTQENLSSHLEVWTLKREAARTLANWDMYPLQAQPVCGEPTSTSMIWRIRPEDIHPDGVKMLNGTTINFLLSYKNPRRPPMWHENFWTVRHFSNGSFSGEMEVSSSAAEPSWVIISKLRWIQVLIHTEVLRPMDTATFHFEFVTVNLADTLRIIAISPDGFDFTDAFINNPPDPPEARRLQSHRFNGGGRRLLWQGFTKNMVMNRTSVSEMVIRFDVARVEYVRFRIEGIRIPWQGGQALFSFFTEWAGGPADEMQNCCYPGYPEDNPAVVFQVPYRLTTIFGAIKNEYQQDPYLYPIESQWETRFDEECILTFDFQVPTPHMPIVDNGLIVVVLRAPPGYLIFHEDYMVSDASGCVLDKDGVCGLAPRSLDLIRYYERRIEIGLPGLEVMPMQLDYRLTATVRTPLSLFDRANGSAALWVVELSDAYALGQKRSSTTLGAPEDFVLLNSVNFSVVAPRSPPATLIVVEVMFRFVGEIKPTAVEIYAPTGFTFLPNCMAPDQDVTSVFVSCRERQTIFGRTYLSGAVMMTVNSGVPPDELPVTVKLMIQSPEFTPSSNVWFVRGRTRFGPVSWGRLPDAFPIAHMDASMSYAAISGVRVSGFLSVAIRYELQWGYHLHVAAPRTYKLFCPVTKVLSGLEQAPVCSNADPILAGCWGLPLPGDPQAKALGLPVCDPDHEVMLTFTRPPLPTPPPELNESAKEAFVKEAFEAQTNTPVVAPGGGFLISLELQVSETTPVPRLENMFRFRILDESKNSVDGKLNMYGPNIVYFPIVENFRLWWTDSVPNSLATVSLEFDFNNSVGSPTRVIDILAPQGINTAIRRPSDVKHLIDDFGSVPVANWSWSNVMTRHIWFSLDDDPSLQNFTGRFHYAWPIMTPTEEVGMPVNNLWKVMFCSDAPYCTELVLEVPIPGFFFGEQPDFELTADQIERLTGSWSSRLRPSWLLTAGFVVWLVLPQSTFLA